MRKVVSKYPESEVFVLTRIKALARRTLYLRLGTATLEWRPGYETGPSSLKSVVAEQLQSLQSPGGRVQLAAGGSSWQGPAVSLGARFWSWGVELKAAPPPASGAHLVLCSPAPFPRLPPLPSKNPPPRKPLGALRPQPPPCRRPPEPLPRPPNPPEGAVAARGTPSRRLPPHLRVALFITARLFWASRLEPAAALC